MVCLVPVSQINPDAGAPEAGFRSVLGIARAYRSPGRQLPAARTETGSLSANSTRSAAVGI